MNFKQIVSLFMVGILVAFVPWVSGCGGGSSATGSSAGGGATSSGTLSLSGSVVLEDADLQALGVSSLKAQSVSSVSRLKIMGLDDVSLHAYRRPRLMPMATNLEYTAVCKVFGSDGEPTVLNDSNGKPVTLTLSEDQDTSMKWSLNSTDPSVIEAAKNGIIPSITCENKSTGASANFEALVAPDDVKEALEKKETVTVPITTATKVAVDQITSQLKESLSPLVELVGTSAENKKLIETAIAKIIELAAPILVAAIEKLAAADSGSLPTLVTAKGQDNVQYAAFQQQLQKNKSVTETSKSMDNLMVREMASGAAGKNEKMQKFMADRDMQELGKSFNKEGMGESGAKEHYRSMMSRAAQGDGSVGTVSDIVTAVNGSLSDTEKLDATAFAKEITAFIADQQAKRAAAEKAKTIDTALVDGTLFSPVMEVYHDVTERPVWEAARKLDMMEMKLCMDYLAEKKSLTGIDIGYVMAYLGGAVTGGGSGGPGSEGSISIRYNEDLPIRVMQLPGTEDLVLNSRVKIESFDNTVWDKAKVTLTYTRKSGGQTTVEFDPPSTAEKNLYERAWYLGDRTVDGTKRGPQITDFSPNSKATITVTYTAGGKETTKTIDTTLRYIDMSKIKLSLINPARVASSDKADTNKELVSAYSAFDVVFEASGAKDGDDYEVKYAMEITEVGAKEGSGFIYSSFPYSIWHESGGASLYPNGQGTEGFKAGTYQLLIQPVAVSKRSTGEWEQRMMATGTPVITYFKLVDSASDISGTEGVIKGTVKASSSQPKGTTLRVGLFDHSAYYGPNNPVYKPVVSTAVGSDGTYLLAIKADELIKESGASKDSTGHYSFNRSFYLMVWEDYDSQGTQGSADLGSITIPAETYLSSDNPSWFGNKSMSIYLEVGKKTVKYNVYEYSSAGAYLGADKPSFDKPLTGTLSGVDFAMDDHPSRSSGSSAGTGASASSSGFTSSGGYDAGYYYGGFSYTTVPVAPGVSGTGSTGGTAASSAVTTYSAPTVMSISPSAGYYQGMDRILIQGGSLVPNGRVVQIGTWEAHVMSESGDGTELKIMAPYELPAGTYDILVKTDFGSSKAGASTKFTVINKESISGAPSITLISPSPTKAGEWVTIQGSNLVDIKSIKIGSSQEAMSYNSTGPTSLELLVPGSMTSGTYAIAVTTEHGTSPASAGASLIVVSSTGVPSSAAVIPFITSLSSTAWPNTSAVSVTVQGTGLDYVTGADLVDSAGKVITKLQYTAGTSYILPVKVPSGLTAGTYYIRITNSAGQSPSTAYNQFTVEAPVTYGAPEIDSISPSSGLGTENNDIYVTGKNFVNIPYLGVKVGPYYASHFKVLSPTTMIVTTVTVLQPDDYQIVITNEKGEKNSAANPAAKFTVLSASASTTVEKKYPALSSVSPSSGREGQDINLTISGSNFTGAVGAKIGGYPLTHFSVTHDGLITATLPAGLSTGSYSIEVFNASGSNFTTSVSPANSTFVIAAGMPAVTYVDPSSTTAGLARYGVKLSGSNFAYGMSAKLVNISSKIETALSYASVSDGTTAYVDIPSTLSAGTYDIVVTTSAGASTSTSKACQFTVYEATVTTGTGGSSGAASVIPTVTSVTPSSVTGGSGTDIVISGSYLTGVSKVVISGSYSLSPYIESNSTMRLFSPYLWPGTHTLELITTDGTHVPVSQTITVTAPTTSGTGGGTTGAGGGTGTGTATGTTTVTSGGGGTTAAGGH